MSDGREEREEQEKLHELEKQEKHDEWFDDDGYVDEWEPERVDS
jgi:hypothetical protein